MKIKSNLLLICTLIAISLSIASCQRTTDALGLDSINNIVKAAKWTSLSKDVVPLNSNTGVHTDELLAGQYIKFKSDGRAYKYDANDVELSSASYEFKDTKTLVYDGITYKIEENFVSTISRMTCVNAGTINKTTLTFRR